MNVARRIASRPHSLAVLATALMMSACGREDADGGVAPDVAGVVAPAAAPAPPRHRIYVTNEMSGDMTVIEGDTHRVLATVPLGKRPRGIQASPDGRQLFVALSGTPIAGPEVDRSALPAADPTADGIGVVDVATLTLSRVIRGVSDPEQLVVSPDGKRLYIASEDSGEAVILDVVSGKQIAKVAVGGEPEGVGISPDGRFVYVTSEEHHQVSVIDTQSERVVKQFGVGQRPRQAAFTPDGARAYVTGETDGTVSVVDTSTHSVIHTIRLGGDLVRPMEVDIAPDGQWAFVTTGRGGTVVAIDVASHEPKRTVAVGQRPWGLALSPDGARLYTANGPSNDVSIVDVATFRVAATVAAGTRPWGVVVVPVD